MITKIKDSFKKVLAIVLLLSVITTGAAAIGGDTAHAAPCKGGQGGLSPSIFIPWYQYLDCDANGAPNISNWSEAIPLIAMAVIEMLIRIGGLIAVGFIIWGGIQYTTSQGEPEGLNNAKSTILNAVIGLIIVIIAIGITQFVAGLIK